MKARQKCTGEGYIFKNICSFCACVGIKRGKQHKQQLKITETDLMSPVHNLSVCVLFFFFLIFQNIQDKIVNKNPKRDKIRSKYNLIEN